MQGATEIAQIEGKLIEVNASKSVAVANEIKVSRNDLDKYDSLLKEGAAV